MRLYSMSEAELRQAVLQGTELALRLRAELPLVADLLLDATGLALEELLVNALGGNRATAGEIARRARSESKQ
jgi:hypothetical protein